MFIYSILEFIYYISGNELKIPYRIQEMFSSVHKGGTSLFSASWGGMLILLFSVNISDYDFYILFRRLLV